MTIRFLNIYLEKLYAGKLIKNKPQYNNEVVIQFKKTVIKLEQAENSSQLRQFRSLHFEALKGDKKWIYSVRVNKQYRLEFKIENDSISLLEIIFVKDLSKHYE